MMTDQQNSGFDPNFQGPDEDAGLDIQEYYRVIKKHRSIVLISLVLCVVLVTVWTYTTIPIYRASSLIVIDSQSSKSPLTGERMNYESYFTENARFKTHAKLLLSRAVLEQVAINLGMHEEKPQSQESASPVRGFLKEVKASIRLKENIDTLTGKDKENTKPGSKIDAAAVRLKSSITVNEVRDTMLYEISVEDSDPIFARDAANAMAKTYIEFDIANRVKYSQNSFQWMSDQFYGVKKKLEDTERDFLNYKEDEKLFSVEGRQDEILNKIREANNSYIETRNKRLEIESKLKELNSISTGSKDDIRPALSQLNSPLLNSLYNQLIEAEMEKTRLSKVFKEKHPKMIQVNSRIDDITETIREEIDKEKRNLDTDWKALKARETLYQKTAEDYEGEALAINRKQLQYTILERDVETNQRLHDTLLAKLKEADITDTMVASNIRVGEEATKPKSPFKPNKRRNFLLSLIVGLMIGIGLAFLRENIDRTLHTEEDVQRVLGLTVLSVIPKAEKATDDNDGKKEKG
jgi:succinoglycan biosynthesis transport protein ExoP